MIREAMEKDLHELLELYLHLHEKEVPDTTPHLEEVWMRIIRDPYHHLIVAEEDGHVVSSCVCVIIPNLTRNARPYAVIENVVTDETYRGRGLASECLQYARSAAEAEDCYKIMLLTGAKEEATLNFYRRAGFKSGEKTAFVQWI